MWPFRKLCAEQKSHCLYLRRPRRRLNTNDRLIPAEVVKDSQQSHEVDTLHDARTGRFKIQDKDID